jgi:hypothetical protein
MNTFISFVFFLMAALLPSHAFHFVVRRWDFGGSHDTIDTLAVDNGNLFLSRNNKMQWLRPRLDKPIVHQTRDFPRTINRLSIKKKSILVNLMPDNTGCVSETLVFSNDKCCRVAWKDNTMYEALVEKNGYVLRSNFFGNITYGNHDNLFTYNTRVYTNTTYTAMVVYDNHLWCATEFKTTHNNTRMTRIDAFDLFVRLDGHDYISSVPDMSFLVENKGCLHPCQLSVSVEKHHPKNIIYLIVGYMVGGVNVAQAFLPTEKKFSYTMCSNLPNENHVRSISWDRPYLFFLDEEGISAYKIFPRMDIHQYMGKHKLPKKYFTETTQIVSLKKQVFWNGEQSLYSAEVVE